MMFKRKKRKIKEKKEKENKDCHEIHPEINGEGLAYKTSAHVISIPNVTLATRYLPMKTTNQMPATSGANILYLNEKSMELFQYKLTRHTAKKECSAQHKYKVPAASS